MRASVKKLGVRVSLTLSEQEFDSLLKVLRVDQAMLPNAEERDLRACRNIGSHLYQALVLREGAEEQRYNW